MNNNFKLVFFLIVCSIQAQKKYTLEECIEIAIEENISIKQGELDVELANISGNDTFGDFLPSLNTSVNNAWNTGLTQDVTTGVLRTQTSRNSSYNLNVGLNIFNGLRNVRSMQRASLLQTSAEYGIAKIKDDVSLFVTNAYLDILTNKQNLKSLKLQNLVTQKQIKQTNELVESGVLPKGDLLEIKATYSLEQQAIVNSENALFLSKISLAQLLQFDEVKGFDVEDYDIGLLDLEIMSKDLDEIILFARDNRNELKIAEQNLEMAQKDLQISKGNYYPSLSGFFNYNTRESDFRRTIAVTDPDNPIITTQIGYVGATNEAVLSDVPNTTRQEVKPDSYFNQLSNNDGISYGLRFMMPVFNGFNVRSSVRRSKVNVLRQQNNLEQAKLDLDTNVYRAFANVKAAYNNYEASQKTLESQTLAFNYAKERFTVGFINALQFSQAKQRYDSAIISENSSKFDFLFKLKVLELYFGLPIASSN